MYFRTRKLKGIKTPPPVGNRHTNMDYQTKAHELLKQFTKENERGVYAFTHDAIENGGNDYAELSRIIHESDVHEDYAYPWIVEFLEYVTENEDTNPDELVPDELVPRWADEGTSVYTHKLTEFLAHSVKHTVYADDVLGEMETKDTATLLMLTMYKAREEIANDVMAYIQRACNDGEE